MPIPDTFLKKSSFKIGVGVGFSAVNLNFKTSEWEYQDGYTPGRNDHISFSKNSLSIVAFGQYDYFFNRRWSIGVNIDYKYVPVEIDAFRLMGYYAVGYDEGYNSIYNSMSIDFPERRVNLGGFGFRLNLVMHF